MPSDTFAPCQGHSLPRIEGAFFGPIDISNYHFSSEERHFRCQVGFCQPKLHTELRTECLSVPMFDDYRESILHPVKKVNLVFPTITTQKKIKPKNSSRQKESHTFQLISHLTINIIIFTKVE